ncbi:MAG: ParB/RepB/Spo0J family partition protein [Candidatus Saccharibacteria bacterium]|nr:ParB/RepB/Spo0J family partition protein [Candidatus Saccharibacteria bacterium]
MSKPKSGLGKGFDSLIPASFDRGILNDTSERVQKLFIKDIQPNAEQPRRYFDEQALHELSSSIKRFGILQPLIVTPGKQGSYNLVAGERRWRAAQEAGLTQVPAIVRNEKELEQLEISLIENVQRVDLSPLEQAVSIEKLHVQFNLSYKEIAERLGKAVSTVNIIVRLLNLPEEAIVALRQSKISEGHARAILALKDQPKQQLTLLESIKKYGWSVRQAEQFVASCKQGATEKSKIVQRMAESTPETERLSKLFASTVSLKRTARGGRIEIHFKSEDELKKIFDQFNSL